MQHIVHQIKAQQFYTDFGLSTVLSPTEIEEFKDFSSLLSDFPVLFKADLIFKDFSRKPSKIQVPLKPVRTMRTDERTVDDRHITITIAQLRFT